MKRLIAPILIVGCVSMLALWSCQSAHRVGESPKPTATDGVRAYLGIENAVAYHQGVISGGVPDGDLGFETLEAWGVRTIISVDGAAPEVERAESRGMRYIHLPIGYDGIDPKRQLDLARAVRDARADGPVYIHCHHGRHRSAAAAAIAGVSLGWGTNREMIERMRVSGTSPHYAGLYECVEAAQPIEPSRLDEIPGEFPSLQRPSSMVDAMVQLEHALEHLEEIEASSWRTPTDHPDLVPAAEAGAVVDLLRVLSPPPELTPSERRAFQQYLEASTDHAKSIESLLDSPALRPAVLSARLQQLSTSCRDCHVQFRD